VNVVIIGGSSGLGRATAQLLADDDPRVMIRCGAGKAAGGLPAARRQRGMVQTDVGSLPEIDALADRVKAEFNLAAGDMLPD
jgi:NAD(P)-dependent dehydrogenase (short-subunit alcohol dehydrogenase family)